MMIILIGCSFALFVVTLALLYLNWHILRVTKLLHDETITIRQDTQVIRKDTRRVADSFEIKL